MFTRCLQLLALTGSALLAGCASIVGNLTQGFADDLSAVVLNSEDPALVRDGAPAFLLLMDGLLGDDSKNADLLASAAALNSAYATAFVADETRQKLFAVKALRLAERSACVGLKNACDLREREFDRYEAWVATLGERDVPLAYGLATAWAGWIQAHADDWGAIAELGRVKTLMARVAEIDPGYEYGGPELYLGVFETLLPPALGGRPEVGRKHFENAIELAEGRFLPAKVFFASQYARLVFDRELHDELLNDVLGSDPKYDGLTLINLIAKEQARELLESADEYF
ncbi:MAG: TRAP transporter TatT component family protein [Pseudomonadota bacterium]